MRRVFICSPYSGDVEANVAIAQRMMRLALEMGYAPFAPHLLYPQVLDDAKPAERDCGLLAGKCWLAGCDEVWYWADAPVSAGMEAELRLARALGIKIVAVNDARMPQDGQTAAGAVSVGAAT